MSDTIKIKVYLNTLRQKGNLAYEYNPFYNYQTDEDLYLIDNKYVIPEGTAVNLKNGEILHKRIDIENGNEVVKWIDKRGVIISSNYSEAKSGTLWAKAGSLIDLDTELLNFDLDHPVEIEVLPSYDGSVNLILNDDKNIPRLINSRFSVREKDTYEIVDRIGENDTNIYSSSAFNKNTSLYYLYENSPKVTYLGFVKGNLPVGQYCFYFTHCDSDGNETDIIAETGLIPVFIGEDNNPNSMDGGIKNQSSNKGIFLKLNDIDTSYNYLKVYFVRYFADYQQNRVFECKKLYKKFPVNSNTIYLQITGTEDMEDLDPNILNISRFNPKSVLTLALCKNMLFLGNIVKHYDNYKELTDLALRIVPKLNVIKNFPTLDYLYTSESLDNAYYNSINIYNKTGYFNLEFYRFGVVFVYDNGVLSNVYPTLGGILDYVEKDGGEKGSTLNILGDLYTQLDAVLIRNYIKIDENGWIKDDDSYKLSGQYLNARGVCLFNYTDDYDDNTIFSVTFNVPEQVSKQLKEDLGIRGFFFVRQKCIPTILALCYLLAMDEELQAPVLETGTGDDKKYTTECFVTQYDKPLNIYTYNPVTRLKKISKTIRNGGRLLLLAYDKRLYEYENKKVSTKAFAGICPDFALNLPYYNQIFNGKSFYLLKVSSANSSLIKLSAYERFYTELDLTKYNINDSWKKVTICSVTEDVPTVAIKDKTYKLNIGECEEVFRFKYAEVDNGTYNAGDETKYTKDDGKKGDIYDKINEATNIVRGTYSPYLAIYSNLKLETGCLYNIYSESISLTLEFLVRMDSSDYFYSIGERQELVTKDMQYTCFRGDCYLNQYTHRLNRNFNDPSLPNNDVIIDQNSWKNNYDVKDLTKWEKISRSDINAVRLGSWITFKVRSAMNYALRSVDHSYVSEEALMGAPRSFFPRSYLLDLGANKLPDSCLYNDAYRASLGYKCYQTILDVNYVKDTFSNRIQYSAISILDSYKNNYRYSLSTYYRDYSMEYGSILKLIGFEGHLLVIFEHGIGIAVVNERILAGTGDGEPVFINTQNVLPEELTILTDCYGTLWGDSVIKTDSGAVYGVDTIAKKIWRVLGQNVEILSDFKVNKFLLDNISLGERELYPTIGLKNVKTHYNANKRDVIFTFYDDVYKDEEKVWSLCYNELLGMFITFYSWIPSFSANIDTKFFTFDRNTAKELSLLYKSNYSIPENTGVLVDSPVIKDEELSDGVLLYYVSPDKTCQAIYTVVNDDSTTSEKTVDCSTTELDDKYVVEGVAFRLEKDHWLNYKLFECVEEEIEEENPENNLDSDSSSSSEEIIEEDYSDSDSSSDESDSSSDDNNLVHRNIKSLLRITTEETKKVWKLKPKEDVALEDILRVFENLKVILLYITPYILYLSDDSIITNTSKCAYFKTEVVAITLDSILNNPLLTEVEKNRAGLTTDFYLHGQAGIFDVVENLYPTYWYNLYHPFEFEFVVNDKIGQLKIFENLVIISNKAEPESFHFEIEGDNYEFSSDKRNMYFRLEATKNLFLNLGSDVLYNRSYTDVAATKYTHETYYRPKTSGETVYQFTDKDGNLRFKPIYEEYPIHYHDGLVQLVKSTIFPLYYEKIDTYNDIYHKYHLMHSSDATYDFLNLSGSEITWDRDLNQFNIVTHIKNNLIDLVGRLRGNSRYKEGKWNILIPSIVFMLKNEDEWPKVETYEELYEEGPLKEASSEYQIPPIVINSQYVPNDLDKTILTVEDLPNIYTGRLDNTVDYMNYQDPLNNSRTPGKYVDTSTWTARKETKIRDKWMKVRIRYSGKNLAIIHSIATLYNLSYS